MDKKKLGILPVFVVIALVFVLITFDNSIDDTKLQGNLGQLSFVIPKSYIAGAIGHIELRGIQGIDENTSRKIKKNKV